MLRIALFLVCLGLILSNGDKSFASEFKPLSGEAFPIADFEPYLKKAFAEKGVDGDLELDRLRFSQEVNGKTVLTSEPSSVAKVVALKSLEVFTERSRFEAYFEPSNASSKQEWIRLQGQYTMLTKVPALKNKLRKGETIYPGNIIWISMDKDKLSQDVVTNTENLEGKLAKRILVAGKPIEKNDISSPTVVDKGKRMPLVYITDLMEIRTVGEVMEQGVQGQIIQVKNVDSKKTVYAQIMPEGYLQVNYEHGASIEQADKGSETIQR